MTTAQATPKENKYPQTKKLAAALIPLLICYIGGALLAYFAASALPRESYSVSCTIPSDSVYGALSAMASALKSGVRQILLISLSAFTFFPSWISAFAAVYRGMCMGFALVPIQLGLVSGANNPEAAVLLYFLASVLLLLLSACAAICSDALRYFRLRKDRKGTHTLLFSYAKWILVLAGGALAASAFAILIC